MLTEVWLCWRKRKNDEEEGRTKKKKGRRRKTVRLKSGKFKSQLKKGNQNQTFLFCV
jgi:hypothetical protein